MNKEKKNTILYTIGVLISVFGSSIYTFAIGLFVLKETGSGMSFSLSLLFGFLPRVILLPIAGVFIDKLDKKKVVILMDSLNGCLFIFTFIIASTQGLSLGLIYTSTLLTNVFTTIFSLSMNVSRPQLVKKKNLVGLNAKGNMINSLATIGGPIIGGLVFAMFNIQYFFLISGISFMVSALIEFAMDFNLNAIETISNKNETFTQSLKEGIIYLKRSTTILKLIQAFAILNFVLAFAFNIANPIILTQYFQLNSRSYGFIQAFFPIGTIIGAMTLKQLNKKLNYGQIIKYSAYGEGFILIGSAIPVLLSFASFHTSLITIIYSLLNMLLGLCISYINIPIMYFVQTEVEATYRARVLSLGTTAANFTVPLGIILGGSIINLLPLYILPFVGGVMSLVLLIPLLASVNDLSMD